jgi:hypothetical protein
MTPPMQDCAEMPAGVSPAIDTAGMTANIPAFLLSGVLVGILGPRGVYLLGAAIAIPAGFIMLRAMRALRRLAESQPA